MKKLGDTMKGRNPRFFCRFKINLGENLVIEKNSLVGENKTKLDYGRKENH